MLPAQNSVLEFPQQVWNFGTIREADGAVSHEFEFENKGKSPVVIEKVTVTCGCTTPQYSREPVRPGGRGTIRIAYNPEGRPGAFRKDITIQSSGGGRNVISITGEVTPRPQEVGELYPVRAGALRLATRTVNLGYVPRGSIKAKTIEYYNDTERPLNMTVVYPKTKPYLDVALSATRIEPKQKGVLTVTYDLRDCDVWGVLSGAFSLMVNDELADTEFSATGIATDDFSSLTAAELEQAPKAAFSSQYYHFGNQKAAGELRRDFTLTNDGKEPLVFPRYEIGTAHVHDARSRTGDRPGRKRHVQRYAEYERRPRREADGSYRIDRQRSVAADARNPAGGEHCGINFLNRKIKT